MLIPELIPQTHQTNPSQRTLNKNKGTAAQKHTFAAEMVQSDSVWLALIDTAQFPTLRSATVEMVGNTYIFNNAEYQKSMSEKDEQDFQKKCKERKIELTWLEWWEWWEWW